MALFTDAFNGSSGAQPTTMTKTKGGALYLRYVPAGNALAPDSTAGDIRYIHNTWPGQKNYRAILRFQFHNPVSASNILRFFIRYDEVDKNGYYVWIDTNFDDPQIKLFKLVDGVSTQIGSTFAPGVGSIPVDTSRDIEIQADGERIVAWWNGATDIDNPDIDATDDEIYVHGSVGIGCELCDATDILFENLEVNEPRKTASAIPSGTGLLLMVDDVGYDEAALQAANVQISKLTKSVVSIDTLELFQKRPFTSPLFRPEQVIQLFVDISAVRTRVFHGKLRVIPQSGSGDSESIAYTAFGYRANWQYINVEHPTTLSSEIVWNGDQGDDDDYDAAFASLNAGQYLKFWLDYYEDTIKFYFGSDPAAGSPYVQADLDALTNSPSRMTLSGTLDAHIQGALNMQRNRVLVMDYGTGQLRIRDLDSLVAYSIASSSVRIVNVELGLDTSRVFTASRVKGVTRELVQAVAKETGGDLVSAWDPGLEISWTRERAKRREMSFEIDSVSVGTGPGGRDEIVLKSAADEVFEDEWLGTSLEITNGLAMGEIFEVFSNSGSVGGLYTFVINGNFVVSPAAGDAARVTDDQALSTTTRHNGFAYVNTLFRISDTTKREMSKEKCPEVFIPYEAKLELWTGGESIEQKKLKIGMTATDVPKDGDGYIRLNNPAVMNPKDFDTTSIAWRPPGCNESTHQDFLDHGGDVELNYEFYRTTVVQARFPTEGWYGEAFSYNNTKWSIGDAVPEFGDIGVMREELENDSELRYQEQQAAWVQILTDRVKVLSRAPWNGTISYRGLDWNNVNFTKKISLEFEVGKRGNANWDGQYLIPTQWVWDFKTNINTVSVGTMASFIRDLEDEKRSNEALIRANVTMARRLRQLKDLQQCRLTATQTAGAPDPGPICGSSIYTGAEAADGSPGRGDDLDGWIEFLWWMWFYWEDFIENIFKKQKGISNITPTYSDGKPSGWTFDFGGSTYHTDGTGKIYDSLGNDVTDTIFSQGFDGIEGAVQDSLMANKKALEGITFVGFTASGIAQFTDAAGNTIYAKKDGTGFTSSSTGVGTTVFPKFGGVIGGILANLGKTIDNATGLVVSPGTAVGASGGSYYPVGGGTVSLGAGAIAPSSLSSLVKANKALLEGLIVNTGSGTITAPDGSTYRANANGTFTKLSGAGASTPQVGGIAGGLLGKCGTTLKGGLNGAATAPGGILPPGEPVTADLAVYYPPTQAEDDADGILLASTDTAPASTLDQWQALAHELGLELHQSDDPGGVVYEDSTSGLFFMCEPVPPKRFKEVEAVTAGTGINGGDWDWVSPDNYHTMSTGVSDHGALTGLADDDHPHYLNDARNGWKYPVRMVATANLTKSATQTVDGVTGASGDRILLTAQSNPAHNGIWVMVAGAWSRATDLDHTSEFKAGIRVAVGEGTVGAGKVYYLATAGAITVDTTNQTWTEFTGGGVAGTFIQRTVLTNTAGGTHTPDANAVWGHLIAVGAGGGGGGAAQAGGQCGCGGGGAYGGIVDLWFLINGNITWDVGAGGVAGPAGNNPGSAGGDTTASCTGMSVTAKGGLGGSSMAAGTSFAVAAGGLTQAGTTGGDVDIAPAEGQPGVRIGGGLSWGGMGASGPYGGGGQPGVVDAAGSNGTGYGSGGGGASCKGTGGADKAGGTGRDGIFILEEYY